jgi:hypothetical protein
VYLALHLLVTSSSYHLQHININVVIIIIYIIIIITTTTTNNNNNKKWA